MLQFYNFTDRHNLLKNKEYLFFIVSCHDNHILGGHSDRFSAKELAETVEEDCMVLSREYCEKHVPKQEEKDV